MVAAILHLLLMLFTLSPAGTERATLTVPEAAKRLGIGKNQAYAAVREGTIPSLRIGSRILVPVAALERMLAGEGDRPTNAAAV